MLTFGFTRDTRSSLLGKSPVFVSPVHPSTPPPSIHRLSCSFVTWLPPFTLFMIIIATRGCHLTNVNLGSNNLAQMTCMTIFSGAYSQNWSYIHVTTYFSLSPDRGFNPIIISPSVCAHAYVWLQKSCVCLYAIIQVYECVCVCVGPDVPKHPFLPVRPSSVHAMFVQLIRMSTSTFLCVWFWVCLSCVLYLIGLSTSAHLYVCVCCV